MSKRLCNTAGMKKYVEILYLLNPANETKLLCNETIFYNWEEEKETCCTFIQVPTKNLYYECEQR
jgi:hypothetical protein